ncbi:hypothetical protein D3C72_1799890 [compost metagenome]
MLEDAVPFRALQPLDQAQRFLALAGADLGPGDEQLVHQPVEVVRSAIGEDLLGAGKVALANGLEGACHGGDALDGFVALQLFGQHDAFIEIAVHEQRDHQPFLDVQFVRRE